MDSSTVGYKYQLRAGEDQDCDNDDCRRRAVVRITEPLKNGPGITYGYYCKSCMPETVTATTA